MNNNTSFKGRGALNNPANRFETIQIELDSEFDPSQLTKPKTVFIRDTSKSLIAYNDSPDVGFNAGINPYRGCEHGCIYCFARPSHEYLSFSSGLDFETKILVKMDAAKILRHELSAKNYQPQPIALSGNTDPYQPIERKFGITRECLEVLAEFQNPVVIITKNRLIERDIDLLQKLSSFNGVKVFLSVTTLKNELAAKMEPRASRPQDRLRAIQSLSAAGIPVGVIMGPIIPGLTDEEIPEVLKESASAGAKSASYIMLRLPFAVKHLFESWLDEHYPERKSKILNRIRAVRHGKLNDSEFGARMRGTGLHADQVHSLFKLYCKRFGYNKNRPPLSTEHFLKPNEQLTLFPQQM